jgi:hypothetical protein
MHLVDFLATEQVPFRPQHDADWDEVGERELDTYIVEQDEHCLRILHFKTEYLISKSDVVEVSAPPLMHAPLDHRGCSARIRLRADAVIRSAFAVRAKEFFSAEPFPFRMPPWSGPLESRSFSMDRDRRWLDERGLLQDPDHPGRLVHAAATMTEEFKTETTKTFSGTAGGPPDYAVVAGDHDDDNEKQVSIGWKNDDPYV